MDQPTLDALKIGLGIAPTDTTQDAWIMLRGDGVLATLRLATGAPLFPLRRYRDIFHGRPWVDRWMEGLTPKHGPIVAIESATMNGAALDVTQLRVTTDNRVVFRALSQHLNAYCGDIEIVYSAGYAALPADLFDILLAILQQTLPGTGGSGIGIAKKVSLVDVGTIEYEAGGWDFANPLGAFAVTLGRYGGGMMVGAPLVVESYDLGLVGLGTAGYIGLTESSDDTPIEQLGNWHIVNPEALDADPVTLTFTVSQGTIVWDPGFGVYPGVTFTGSGTSSATVAGPWAAVVTNLFNEGSVPDPTSIFHIMVPPTPRPASTFTLTLAVGAASPSINTITVRAVP